LTVIAVSMCCLMLKVLELWMLMAVWNAMLNFAASSLLVFVVARVLTVLFKTRDLPHSDGYEPVLLLGF
jgi:hypothetical protein